MKKIDSPNIEKTYIEDKREVVTIYLEDTRDNYIEEDALGKIGSISISKGYVFLDANVDDLNNIKEKEQILKDALKEIFGTLDIDLTSNMPYETIKGMIADGTLETLGYNKVIPERELEEYGFYDELPEHVALERLASTYNNRGRR